MDPVRTVERTTAEQTGGYQRLSRYRGELMGLAMLWVMLFHAYPFTFRVPLLDGIKGAGFAGVDVFLLLSAMGLYVSLHKGGRTGLGDFYLRRLRRVLPAYWLVVGLYSLWLVAWGRIGVSTALWSMSTLHYWLHIPGAFNWYVPALLAFYLLAPWYVRLFDRRRWKTALTIAVFPLAYGIYRLTIPLGLNYTEDFVNRLPAFALGILAGYFLTTGRPLGRWDRALWAALAALGAVVGVLYLRRALYISPCYIIGALLMALCLTAAWAMDRTPEVLRRFLRLLGACSLEIYLLNVIVTREFDTLAPLLDRGPRHLFYYAVVYSANLLLGVGLHRAMERLPRLGAGRYRGPSDRRGM